MLFLSGTSFTTHAASITTETFSVGFSGWNADTDAVWTNGYIRLRFAPATPHITDTFISGGVAASSGAFSGDYRAAGVHFIAFDFMAVTALPSSLYITIGNDFDGAQTDVSEQSTTTNIWQRIIMPVDTTATSLWSPIVSQPLDVVATNVSSLEIRIERSTDAEQVYRIDNISLARLHSTTALDVDSSGVATPLWNDLQVMRSYTVQATTNLVHGVWGTVGTFVATNTVQGFTDTASTNHTMRHYRLLLDWP